MKHVAADQGLLVSWGGFKSSVRGELERQNFFSIRLWGRDQLIEAMLATYENLDPDIRAEIPLKRVWAVARGEDSA
jgi:restriction system protein